MRKFLFLALLAFLAACGERERGTDAIQDTAALDARDDLPTGCDGAGSIDLPRDSNGTSDPESDAPEDTVNAGDDEHPAGDTFEGTTADAADDALLATGPVRFAVVSDTHLTGDPNDAPNRRFSETMTNLEPSALPPERLFITGDVIDDLLAVKDYAQDWLDGNGDPVPVLVEMRRLADTALPGRIRIALGNHDNRFIDQFQGNEVPLAAWLRAFEGSPSFPAPWYAEDIRGCRFVVLWSCEMATNHEENDRPSFSDDQIAWLREQLAAGLPTVVFWHHWIGGWDDPEPPPPLLEALADNPTVADRVTFSGHAHAWQRVSWQEVRFYQTESLRDVPDAIHHVVCDGEAGTITVTNEADIPYPD